MSKGLGQVVSWYICTIVPFIFLCLRLFSRWKRFGKLAIDDGLLILATSCLIGDLAIQQHMWNLGMADIANATPEEVTGIMKVADSSRWIVPGSVLYVTSLWAIKIALVLFYKKLAVIGSKIQIAYSVTLAGLVVTWAVIFFDIIFQCFPHDKRWSQDPNYQCSQKASDINYWITILLNILSDVVIICLPISMVMQLQMKLKQKLGVVAIFALGFFVVISSIIRAYYSKRNETMLTCTVSMVETAVAIIAACLPALRQMFLRHTSQIGTSSYGRHYELSSARRMTDRRRTMGGTSGVSQKQVSSEEELVKDLRSHGSGATSVTKDETELGGITVNTTIDVQRGNGPDLPHARGPFNG